jgi:hypothetical protein
MAIPGVSFEDIQRMAQQATKGVLSGLVPTFAKSVVEAPQKGWCKAEYYDALTGEKFSFYEPPTVVAVAMVRDGSSRLVTAPSIKIPTVELPNVPEIEFPAISMPGAPPIDLPPLTLPTPAAITIPKPEIPMIGVAQTMFYWNAGVFPTINAEMQSMVTSLNEMSRVLVDVQNKINQSIYWINVGLKKVVETAEAIELEIEHYAEDTKVAMNNYSAKIKASIDAGLADLRGKTEATISQFRSNVKTSMNATMSDYRTKTQAAFDSYKSSIEVSMNAGLSQFIPVLYDMMGLPVPALSEADKAAFRDMGDVNGDGIIDQKDMDLLKSAYGAKKGEARYNEVYDLNHDGVIDTKDLAILGRSYGKSIVPTAQLLSPAQLRNVTKDGFEFYGLSAGMKLSYVAVGRR